MTRFTDPSLDADDVVRRLRGALDELTADITESTVAEQPVAPVRTLVRRSSRRSWIVPVATAAAVAAVFAGVVVVGDRGDDGPTGPAVSVPDTAPDRGPAPENATVAGTTFADLEGLEPVGVPTSNQFMTASIGAVWASPEGPDDWFVSIRQESDRDLVPGTLDGGVELDPVESGGRTLYVDPDNGSGNPTLYEWRPGGQLYVANSFGLERDRLVEFVASIAPGSGVPFILTSDDPEFSGAEVAILDPRPTYVSQPWTFDATDVMLSTATGGLARHVADLAASTVDLAPLTVAGESGYQLDATDGIHLLWPSAVGSDLWMHATVRSPERLDDLIGAVAQQPTGLVVGGPMAASAREQAALRGWITRSGDSDQVGRPLADLVAETLAGSDRIPPTAPVVIDALWFATIGEIAGVTTDLVETRRVVLVTADTDSPEREELNDVLRSIAASTPNVVIADWTAALAEMSATDTAEDWIEVVASAVFSGEDGAETGFTPDITSPPPSDPTSVEPVGTSAPAVTDATVDATVPATESTLADTTPMEGAGFVVGASVTLGAAEALAERGFVVNAEVSRQASHAVDVLQQAADAGILPDVVVIHPGVNGSISDETMAALMAAVADVPRVVVITDRLLRTWNEPNNELIRSLPAEHPNVVVLDWATLADACTGDCFLGDGLHLDTDGRTFYADLILAAATG